ncbi:MAG: 3'-5' exonuclease [Desulfovibrio sp.]|uniref:3'-5' exonuclease n=1 Tax=Desulfovibrio sp. 7SRBS1 TaxID=3378064 RepID=UPI003B40C6B7
MPLRRALGLLKKNPQEHPLLQENDTACALLRRDTPLADVPFVVLDTELTGLDPAGDEIVSIGAVHIDSLRIQAGKTFYSVVQPREGLKKLSTLVHRITPDEVRNMPRLRSVLPDLVTFCTGRIIVGHNIGLDMDFLNRALGDVMQGRLNNPRQDTMHLAQVHQAAQGGYFQQFDQRTAFDLAHLGRIYNLPPYPAHNALSDAMQTACLFLVLLRKLRDGRLSTWGELLKV